MASLFVYKVGSGVFIAIGAAAVAIVMWLAFRGQ